MKTIVSSIGNRSQKKLMQFPTQNIIALKSELVWHWQFQNQAEARYAIAEYIERFYNRQRFPQALGYRSPEEFEQQVGES